MEKEAPVYFQGLAEDDGSFEGSPSVTYLQDLASDKLVAGFTFHPEETLVVLFAIRSAIPAGQRASAPEKAEGRKDTQTPFLSALLHRTVAEAVSLPPSTHMSGDLVRQGQSPQNQTIQRER